MVTTDAAAWVARMFWSSTLTSSNSNGQVMGLLVKNSFLKKKRKKKCKEQMMNSFLQSWINSKIQKKWKIPFRCQFKVEPGNDVLHLRIICERNIGGVRTYVYKGTPLCKSKKFMINMWIFRTWVIAQEDVNSSPQTCWLHSSLCSVLMGIDSEIKVNAK